MCVTKLCVREMCEKVVCERAVSDKVVRDKMDVRERCERLCGAKLCDKVVFERDGLTCRVDVTKCHACHAKRRSMSPSATPATQIERRCRQVPRLPRKVPRRHGRPTATKRATRPSPGFGNFGRSWAHSSSKQSY